MLAITYRQTMTSYVFSPAQLSALGHEVAHHGVASANAELGQLLRAAAHVGVSHHVTDVLLDPREPEVARQRAFGVVSVALGRAASAQPVTASLHVNVRESVSV
jgi:hypothetical protein